MVKVRSRGSKCMFSLGWATILSAKGKVVVSFFDFTSANGVSVTFLSILSHVVPFPWLFSSVLTGARKIPFLSFYAIWSTSSSRLERTKAMKQASANSVFGWKAVSALDKKWMFAPYCKCWSAKYCQTVPTRNKWPVTLLSVSALMSVSEFCAIHLWLLTHVV